MSAAERRQVEVELLQAMYPGQVHIGLRGSEFRYVGSTGGSIVLRIPDSYPERELPDLISAVDGAKNDVRTETKQALSDMNLLPGEEILDAIIQGFDEVLGAQSLITSDQTNPNPSPYTNLAPRDDGRYKVVIVWLHHLLNTNKRKLALRPTLSAATDGATVSGITKPGYPGILVYAGPTVLVDAHVAELRQQRWQAFQVRYDQELERDSLWRFEHDQGIIEVESMSDVVQGVVGQVNKEVFLKVIGVK